MAVGASVRDYIRFGMLLVGSLVCPLGLAVLSLLIPQSALNAMPDWLAITVVVIALVSPMPFLYFAAHSAAKSGIPGKAVLAGWWAFSILASLSNWGSPEIVNGIVKAMTLGVIAPSNQGMWGMPRFMVELGSAPAFSPEVPIYVLFLMASFSAVSTRLERARETARSNSRWDENGERIEPSAPV